MQMVLHPGLSVFLEHAKAVFLFGTGGLTVFHLFLLQQKSVKVPGLMLRIGLTWPTSL